jgi:hypothetical protein
MTAPMKVKKIRALLAQTTMPDGDLRALLESCLKGMSANATVFPKSPVDLTAYESTIHAYEGAMPAALDGSKTAIALKNKLKGDAVHLYNQIAHHVESNCNSDMATFLLSGLQPVPTTKAPPQPLDTPTMDVTPGPVSGTLKGKIHTVKKALSYVVHHGAVLPGSTVPATWIEQVITNAKPIIFSNLTPGTIYSFQVKALGRLGYTEWSDPINRMAT